MKSRKIKSIISLTAALVTVLAVSVVTFAAWSCKTKEYNAGSVSGKAEVGFQENVGYAEVKASDNVYAQVDGTATYYIAGWPQYSTIYGSFDEDTYRQFVVTCPNIITSIECQFTVVSDDGRWTGTVSE